MGAFDFLRGQPTVGKATLAPGGRAYGTFNPSFRYGVGPLFTQDGQGTRYGFREYTNGVIVGMEGTDLPRLQAAVDANKVPGVAPGTRLEKEDWYDSLYLMVGDTSLYALYVGGPVLKQPDPNPQPPAQPPAQPPPVVVPPPVQPPVAPPPAGSGLHPLTPASVRVEELRSLIFWETPERFCKLDLFPGTTDTGFKDWPRVKPFAVEALRFYRRLRAKLGDQREIPAEDR